MQVLGHRTQLPRAKHAGVADGANLGPRSELALQGRFGHRFCLLGHQDPWDPCLPRTLGPQFLIHPLPSRLFPGLLNVPHLVRARRQLRNRPVSSGKRIQRHTVSSAGRSCRLSSLSVLDGANGPAPQQRWPRDPKSCAVPSAKPEPALQKPPAATQDPIQCLGSPGRETLTLGSQVGDGGGPSVVFPVSNLKTSP